MSQALAIALNEVTLAKEDRREARLAQDEEGMGDDQVALAGSTKPVSVDQSGISRSKTKTQQNNYLGTSKVIKLPYIIGRAEYKKHPYAGVVYKGEDELE